MYHISDLTPDPQNARRHNPRNIGMIERSLNEVGAARSIVIDEDNVILAGNGLIEAAAQAGIENVRIIEASGDEIIAVRRSGLTAEQKTKLALFDNRTNELSDWEPGVLAEIAAQGVDLSGLFTEIEWADVAQQEREPVDVNELWKGMPDFEHEDIGSWKQLIVHFDTKDDLEAFARLINQTLTPQTKSVWYPERPDRLKGQTSTEKVFTIDDA